MRWIALGVVLWIAVGVITFFWGVIASLGDAFSLFMVMTTFLMGGVSLASFCKAIDRHFSSE